MEGIGNVFMVINLKIFYFLIIKAMKRIQIDKLWGIFDVIVRVMRINWERYFIFEADDIKVRRILRDMNYKKYNKYLNELYKSKDVTRIENIDIKAVLTDLFNWFTIYQPVKTKEEIEDKVRLYDTLINEECDETLKSWYKRSIERLIDGYIDEFWVLMWYNWFKFLQTNDVDKDWDKLLEEAVEIMKKYITDKLIPYDLFVLWLLEVARSNYTKPLEKEAKWDKRWKVKKDKKTKRPRWNLVFNFFKWKWKEKK